MKHRVAEQVVPVILEVTRKLNATIALVQQECTEEEFIAYRRAAGHAMGYLFADIVRPIFHEHPDLEPEELRDPHQA